MTGNTRVNTCVIMSLCFHIATVGRSQGLWRIPLHPGCIYYLVLDLGERRKGGQMSYDSVMVQAKCTQWQMELEKVKGCEGMSNASVLCTPHSQAMHVLYTLCCINKDWWMLTLGPESRHITCCKVFSDNLNFISKKISRLLWSVILKYQPSSWRPDGLQVNTVAGCHCL